MFFRDLPSIVHRLLISEQIAVASGLGALGFLAGEQGAFVFGDPGAFLDEAGGEQAEAGDGAANTEGSAGHFRSF